MQYKMDRKELLLENGQIKTPGYAVSPLWTYKRDAILAPKYKIKEWDYYLIYNNEYGLALTVADNGYIGALSASILNFKTGTYKTMSSVELLTFGKYNMPESPSHGHVNVVNKGISIDFDVNGQRRLSVNYPKFMDNKTLEGSVVLDQDFEQDTMVIATPFTKKHAFYYNQKVMCMPAQGQFTLGEDVFTFGEGSFGILDWGRGVWTFKNTWYWGGASGTINNKPFGFNIGYGFGDTSAATENMLFYDGIGHKLEDIEFHVPDDYLDLWTFTSSDGRFEMIFRPLFDRADKVNMVLIKTEQHQVFGYYSGKAILDDGTVIELDQFLGFAEKVYNKW